MDQSSWWFLKVVGIPTVHKIRGHSTSSSRPLLCSRGPPGARPRSRQHVTPTGRPRTAAATREPIWNTTARVIHRSEEQPIGGTHIDMLPPPPSTAGHAGHSSNCMLVTAYVLNKYTDCAILNARGASTRTRAGTQIFACVTHFFTYLLNIDRS